MATNASKSTWQELSILFGDIEGFSRLAASQQERYLPEVLQKIALALRRSEPPVQTNTWGDGLVAFFVSPINALKCALAVRDMFRATPWHHKGLPPFRIRLSLHVGRVFVGRNPLTGGREFVGTEINRAARIEPIVAANHVYVTRDFVDKCQVGNVVFQQLGSIALPKNRGGEELYVITRKGREMVDLEDVTAMKSERWLEGVHRLAQSLRPSKFTRRMMHASDAKAGIAAYCAQSDFWRPDDIVFRESGALPVYMVFDLYRRRDPLKRPRFLITNNVAALMVGMIGDHAPDDLPTSTILIGGRLWDDYAETIPEDLDPAEGPASWRAADLCKYLRLKKVTHVIMMTTSLSADGGPCAVSSQNRSFKKLLLRYVWENPSARPSILGEAEKVVKGRGWPADKAEPPGDHGERYWADILEGGRVTITLGESSELPDQHRIAVRREMRKLAEAGAICRLAGGDGTEVIVERPQAKMSATSQRQRPLGRPGRRRVTSIKPR